MKHLSTSLVLLSSLGLAACSSMGSHGAYSQTALPAGVQVPAGHQVVLETVGMGQISYECRVKKDLPNEQEWWFVGPQAQLQTRSGAMIGRYWGPPATWEHSDGSKITATQVAVAPNGIGHLPLQLVKANPAMGMGAMQGVSYIQRVDTRGGVAPAMPCSSANLGDKQTVQYQADYIFWKPL